MSKESFKVSMTLLMKNGGRSNKLDMYAHELTYRRTEIIELNFFKVKLTNNLSPIFLCALTFEKC